MKCGFCKGKFFPTHKHRTYCCTRCEKDRRKKDAEIARATLKAQRERDGDIFQVILCGRWSKIKYDYVSII